MPRVLALLAFLCTRAAGTGVMTEMTSMVGMARKMLGGTPTEQDQCTGPSCCTQSTCWSVPGLGCDPKRGETVCVGARRLPPRKGVCSCASGTCSPSGKCMTAAALSQYGQLYSQDAVESDPVPPE